MTFEEMKQWIIANQKGLTVYIGTAVSLVAIAAVIAVGVYFVAHAIFH